MAKREAQARSYAPGAEVPATLTSAAEEHAQALKEELLKSTEQAAKNIVGQTRVEGERRIEVAGRRAQAIAGTISEVEQAERALGDRADAFAAASKALRAELESFSTALSQAEERLRPEADAIGEPDLRLVESPADDANVEAETEAESPEEEPGEDDDDEDEPDSDSDDEPPTPDQIRQFFREAEESEVERAARRERLAAESQRGWFRSFFSGPEARPALEDEPALEAAPKAEPDVLSSRRGRLYTDIAGAIIGLSGAAALINFVILK